MQAEDGRTRKSVSISMQQGVGACDGRLRSNNRAMIMALTLCGLDGNESSRWLGAFKQPGEFGPNMEQSSESEFEIEVELLHSDYSNIGTKSGSKRFPDSLNLVKFDGSILRTETDVVAAPGNTFVISTFDTPQLLLKDVTPAPLSLRELIRVSRGANTKEVEISLKLATNITSKAHSGRRFVFRVNARELGRESSELSSFWGVTAAFELYAKPTTSETASEAMKRQASAHCLASLAFLAADAFKEESRDGDGAAAEEQLTNGLTLAESIAGLDGKRGGGSMVDHAVNTNSCKRAKID